jgi:hypothetical protein
MAFVVKDRVQETSTTTGTGTFTLNGAVTGFKSFSVVGNGNTTYYAITTSGSEFEVGIGTYTSSGTTLSRDTVLSSSNSNNLVDFAAGAKNVFVTYPAERSIYLNSAGSEVVVGKNNTDTSVTTDGTADITISTNSGTNSGTVKIFDGVNGNIEITPNGTGDVILSADTIKIGDSNTDAVLTTDGTGDITISTNSGSNSGTIKIFDGTNGNIEITPNGTGVVKLDGLSYPIADGTANQVLKTNGSGVLSFTTLSGGFNGATTTSSAVDITLTSASTQVQNITMTASAKAVILPDATTLTTKGFPVFVITNQGVFPFQIQNGAGTNIANVNTNTTITLSLLDNSTSAGLYATGTQPIFININPPTAINSGSTGTSLYQTFNEVFQGITCDKIDSTNVIVSYQKGTSNRDVYGRVITISGQSFTVASETLLYNGSSNTASNSNVRMLSSTNGLLVVDRVANTVAIPFTVSGTTISVGSTSSTFGAGLTDATYSGTSRTIPLTSTLGLIANRTTTTGADWVFRTITHNGASAPTIGSQSSSVLSWNYGAPSMVRISDTEAFTVYSGTGVPIARVITVSGSSAPTLQTANTTSTASYPNGHNQLIANSSTNFTFFRDERSTNYTVSGNTTTHVGDRETTFYNSNLTGNLSISKIALGDYIFEYSYYGVLPYLNKRDNGFLAPITGPNIANPYGGMVNGLTFATELDSTTAFIVVSNGVSIINGSVIKYVGV